MDKDRISRNFSRYAKYYDRYCNIQNLLAEELIGRIGRNSFAKILDVGCGTGNYTKSLKELCPGADITAIDISQEMVDIASKKLNGASIRFIVGDAEKLEIDGRFDLITSNACFQWFDDLVLALSKYKRQLSRGGVMLFSVFGPLTFYELGESTKELFRDGHKIASESFIEPKKIKDIMKQLFEKVEIEEKIFNRTYKSAAELIKTIRYTGTAGNGTGKNGLWTTAAVDRLDKIYREKFKNVTATYQVIFCKGVK